MKPLFRDANAASASPRASSPEGSVVCIGAFDGLHLGHQALANTLIERGARVLRADVYARVPVALPAAAMNRLRTLQAPAGLALSSGAALQRVLVLLPAELVPRLLAMPVAAASPRLQQAALEAGFSTVALAAGPLPQQLLAALAPRFR